MAVGKNIVFPMSSSLPSFLKQPVLMVVTLLIKLRLILVSIKALIVKMEMLIVRLLVIIKLRLASIVIPRFEPWVRLCNWRAYLPT